MAKRELIDRQECLDAIIKRLSIKDESYLLEAERAIYQQILAQPTVSEQEIVKPYLDKLKAEIDKQTEIHSDGEFYIKNIDVKRIIDNLLSEQGEQETN